MALAGAVAREINNPLTAVIGNLELAVGTIGEHSAPATEREKELLELVHEALSAAARVRDIVRDYQRIVTEVGGEAQASRLRVPAFAQDAASAATTPTRAAKRPRAGSVLVIDDDETSAATVRRLLARQHIITTFTNARDALKEISAGKTYDIILCDVMMPDVTGMDFFVSSARSPPDGGAGRVHNWRAYTQGARVSERVSNRCLYKPFSAASCAPVNELTTDLRST
jgi:CheY-like chemotaxis protein